jgi:hypothetical protein
MITIVYSTHKDKEYNEKFKTHLLNSVGLNDVQILEYQNNNQYSLAQVYNSGITQSIYDIIVCCHNDIKLEKNWGKKLLDDFSSYPEFGVIGKAGSCYFPESGVYWERMQQTMVGQVWHHPEGQKKWINNYSPKLPFIIPVVTIDGLFISFNKTKIKHKFDETIGKFHFYDHSFTIPNYLDGVKLGVTSSFEITHESIGQPNQEFWESKNTFVEKYKSVLPLDLKPKLITNFYKNQSKLKLKEKFAVILENYSVDKTILSIESFYKFCDFNVFDLFVINLNSDEKSIIEDNYKKVHVVDFISNKTTETKNLVVKKYLNQNHKYIVFVSGNIVLESDILNGFLEVYKTKGKVGTIGCRIYNSDNTINQNGLGLFISKQNSNIGVIRLDEFNYYNFKLGINSVFGNTYDFFCINKNTFEIIGMFNEQYDKTIEDIYLNSTLISKGFINYVNSDLVVVKKLDVKTNVEQFTTDFNNYYLPYFRENFNKLKEKIFFI